MRTRRRGYGAQLGTLIAGVAALTVFDLVHHPAGPAAPPRASVRPTVTVTTHASPAGAAPTGRGARPPAARAYTATIGARSGGSGTPAPSPIPTPAPPGRSPSPQPKPGLGVTAIVVPLRGATPVAVRAALVVPAAPPFPDPLLQAGLNLTLR